MVMVMTIILVILSLQFFSFLVYGVYFSTRQAIVSEIDLVARGISKRLIPVMLFEDDKQGREILSDAGVKDSIVAACLYNNKGNLFADFYQTSKKTSAHCPTSPPSFMGFSYTLRSITLHQEINAAAGNKVASLYIVSDTRQMEDKLVGTSIWALLFLMVAFVLSYVAVRKANHIITTPILSLAKVAETVGRNDYNVRAKKYYNDESGMLADAFNTMIGQVEVTVAELEKTNQDLKHATQLKDIWISNIGHEIRTPIHGVLQISGIGMWECGKEQPDISSLIHYFSRIKQSANRLCKLIEGLLDFQKMKAGKTILIVETADISLLIGQLIDELHPAISAKDIHIQLHPPECSPVFTFDTNGIGHVITNIVSNAVKFSPIGGTIEVSITSAPVDDDTPDGVAISVKDSGVGIPEGEEDIIFDTFTQSSKTYTGAGGTGLGLSIAREMVQLHHGRILARNNKGEEGATFIFILPRQQLLHKE